MMRRLHPRASELLEKFLFRQTEWIISPLQTVVSTMIARLRHKWEVT